MSKSWTFVAIALCAFGFGQAARAAAVAPAEDLSDIKARMNAAQTGDPEQKPGAPVYREHCAQCHEGQAQKAPTKTFLSMMSPEAIYDALAIGIMRPMAVRLDDAQKHH
ncbi:MAG: cytochrome c, partial [Gammaproteobacteria bacterium]|nr:cytochrome c [Gammaproteobacteria bacterium]